MPLYEYRCAGCGHEFEALVRVGDADREGCPACGDGPARRLFSVVAAVRPDAGVVRGGAGALQPVPNRASAAGTLQRARTGGCCGGACGHCG